MTVSVIAGRLASLVGTLVGVACAFVAFPGPSLAQDMPKVITPPDVTADPNGLNLMTGKIRGQRPQISVPGAPRLTFSQLSDFTMYVEGQRPSLTKESPDTGTAYYAVHYGADRSASFQCGGGSCIGINSRSTFTAAVIGPSGLRVEKTGESYSFNVECINYNSNGITYTEFYASRVTYPDGEVLTLTYDQFPGGCYRLNRVQSSTGYYLDFKYWDSLGGSYWNTLQTAAISANSDPATPLAKLDYSSNSTQVTDLAGRTWTCNTDCGPFAFGSPWKTTDSIKLPGEGTAAITSAGNPTNAFVTASVNKDGVPWSYTYGNIASQYISGALKSYKYDSVVATGPNGYQRTYAIHVWDKGSSANPRYQIQYVTSSKDELNRTTNYAYEQYTDSPAPSFRLTKITYPEGNSSEFLYDSRGNVIKQTDKAKPGTAIADLVQQAGYTDWWPTWYQDANGNQTDFTYKTGTNLLEQQLDPPDQSGVRKRTAIEYEDHVTPFSTTITHPNGSTTVIPQVISRKTKVRVCGVLATNTATCVTDEPYTTYAYFGDTFLPTVVTEVSPADAQSRVTTTSYDAAGRVIAVDGPLAGTDDAIYVRYDTLGRKIWEIGKRAPDGTRLTKKSTYRNADDKVTKVETGTVTCNTDCTTASLTLAVQQTADITYDSRRNPIREAVSSGGTTYQVTDRSFLDRGMPDCEATRMNLAALPSATATGACSLGTTGADGSDRITKNTYNTAGELTKIQKAYGTADQADYVTYAYTLNGKQQYVTDAKGNKAQFEYDRYDRLYRWYFPSKTAVGVVNTADYEQYGYDSAGNRTSLRKRDGRTLTLAFDGRGQMISKLVPDGCAPIQVGACPLAAATRDVFYTYDAWGRQLSAKFDSSAGADGLTSTYDGFGNLKSSTISMAGFSKALNSQYDLLGNRTRVTHPDSVYFTMGYDALNRMASASWTTAAGTTPFLSISYDSLGRRSGINRGSSGTGYGYDAVSRLTSMGQSFTGGAGNASLTFGYNPASQIKSETRDNDSYAWTGAVAVNRAYAVNGLNQYTAGGPASFSYDVNGNLITDGTNTYVYDAENRLVSASNAGGSASLTYDPMGRLWQVVKGPASTRFLYDGDELAAEYDATGNMTRRFMFGPNTDEPILEDPGGTLACTNGTRFLHSNHQGSIVALADCWGVRTNIDSYDEYGIPGSNNAGRFQYTGQAWLGEIGMYYYKARIYSPTLGRFLQTDPIGYKDQINLYEYVGDDPVNATDPTGEFLFPWEHPVSVVIGQGPAGRATTAQQMHYIKVINRVLATPRGRELLKQIIGPWWWHGNPQTVVLRPGVGGLGTGVLDDGRIQIDPLFHPEIKTTSGNVIASDDRVIAHELGHGVTGTDDTPNPGDRMDNVKQNENPIVQGLGLSPRTQYSKPPHDPKANPEVPHPPKPCADKLCDN